MERLFLTIAMDLTDQRAEGPGWYISLIADGKSIIPPVAISPEAAYDVSRAAQQAMESTEGELPQVALPQIVESSSRLIREALHTQLEVAEEHAARVTTLRKKIAQLPLPVPTGETT